jgi:hypothetical protein
MIERISHAASRCGAAEHMLKVSSAECLEERDIGGAEAVLHAKGNGK